MKKIDFLAYGRRLNELKKKMTHEPFEPAPTEHAQELPVMTIGLVK